jgi:hypothetical protein
LKQFLADALQAVGAIGVTIAAGSVDVFLGVFVGSVMAMAAGVMLERS